MNLKILIMKEALLIIVIFFQFTPIFSQPDTIDFKNYNSGYEYDFIINNKKYNITTNRRNIYKYLKDKSADSCILFDFNQFINKDNYKKGLLLKNNVFLFRDYEYLSEKTKQAIKPDYFKTPFKILIVFFRKSRTYFFYIFLVVVQIFFFIEPIYA